MKKIEYDPIGIIHTDFTEKEKTPIQGFLSSESKGWIEVFPRFVDGLKDISDFSHLILIYHFHKAECCSLIAKPFLDKERKGIFSIRHFNRPNPIGISIVKLDGVRGNILDISEVDVLDGTPLLDIKPYVPDFDIKHNVNAGWYNHASEKEKYGIN